jgi:hypothetical protein
VALAFLSLGFGLGFGLGVGLGFAVTASAGPVEDAAAAFGRGDYATTLAKIKSATAADRAALQAFAKQVGNSLYGEIAYNHLALGRPDAAEPGASTLEAKADPTCHFALSFRRGNKVVRLWSMPNGAPAATVSSSAVIWSAAVSQQFVAIEEPQAVSLYDIRSGKLLRSIAKPKDGRVQTLGLYFSQDGKRILAIPEVMRSFRGEGSGRLFDVQTGSELPSQTAVPPPISFEEQTPTPDCPLVKQQTFAQ